MDMHQNKKIALGAAIALIAATFLPLISVPPFGSMSLLDALTEGGSVDGWLIPISALAAAYFVWSDIQKFANFLLQFHILCSCIVLLQIATVYK